MTETNSNFDKRTQEMTLIPTELLDLARKQIEFLLDVQKAMMQTLEGIYHDMVVHATGSWLWVPGSPPSMAPPHDRV